MDVLFWITVSFIIIGFVVIASMKKGMESKLASIKHNASKDISTRPIVLWIVGSSAWGIVSIILIVWWFNNNL
ncbi:hypothetical protein [Halalkalibacter okhensis]|uniref:Uncharacterized protein n=1 Tax=Halalkalibacter okhensis TaxID=333138 RepID=A0A0B0ID44_9BACI|nr:hypothetical protein [Halalkalibacter okhensis]KHF39220.1 hypothetical protein LQ50_16890 [Halalkalibacter okhensis]